MNECLLCNEIFKNIIGLSTHITRFHKITSKKYYDKFLKTNNTCNLCKKQTKYISFSKGYRKFCTTNCYGRSLKNRIFSEEHKQKLSKASKGKLKSDEHKNNTSKGLKKYYKTHSNPFKGKHHTKESKEKIRRGHVGLKQTQEHKDKIGASITRYIERNGPNTSYKGRYTPQHVEKYIGDPSKIVYRSLWERAVFRRLDLNTEILKWGSEEIPIKYRSIDNKIHTYFPDIYFEEKLSNGKISKKIIEIKPNRQTQPPKELKKKTKRYFTEQYVWGINNAKWQAAKKFCDFNNIEFEIWTEYTLKSMGIRVNIT